MTQPKSNESEEILILQRAEKMRIAFVANVSHELRTPLTSIKGYTDTLVQDLEEGRETNANFLKIISRNVDRLILLIDDLLDLSSIESGADQIRPEHVNTVLATQHVMSNLQHIIESKGHDVVIDSKVDSVYADSKRVEQVLTNLLENACKYCLEQTKIEVRWSKNNENQVVLEIEDHGPGIPEKHLGRLFERFYRVDKGRSRELGGTGLGLAIVKHIMQRHEGSVSVRSEMGRGTCFTCVFGLTEE